MINDAFGYSEKIFREVRRTLPKTYQVLGFSGLHKVPYAFYGKFTDLIIEQKDYCSNAIAKLLLKGWSLKHENLKTTVQRCLLSAGYEVNELNFIKNSLEINPLEKEDLFSTTDGVNYFRPKGEKIEGFDELEITIMSALYGWIALPLEVMGQDDDVTEPEEFKETVSTPFFEQLKIRKFSFDIYYS